MLSRLPGSITAVKRRVTARSAGDRPGGLGGAVYLLVRSFVDVRGRRCFPLGFGGVIECRASMLDRTGALIGE